MKTAPQGRQPHVRIGELAASLGLNPKTIRYYEELGLLPPAERSESGYRLYSPTDRDRLRFIRKARAVGLTLEEIGQVMLLRREGQRPCAHVVQLLDTKLAALDEHVRALTGFREELASLRAEAAESMDADACVCGVIEQHQPAHADEAVQGYLLRSFPPRPRRR